MKFDLRNINLHIVLSLLVGVGLGLLYAWKISPVTYVDATPALLRTDFKDQYRAVIAASYASTHDLPRARARLELLGDSDLIGELSGQAQRMLAAGEPFARVQSIAQLATDLGQGSVSIQTARTSVHQIVITPAEDAPLIEEPATVEVIDSGIPTYFIEGTPLAPPPSLFTPTPQPTRTPLPAPRAPFTLVGQDTVCDISLRRGLLQIVLMDSRRQQVPGIRIIVTWDQGENQFFTGFKPELGNGYADFLMRPDTRYSVRIVEGGSFVPNIMAPTCTEPNGNSYLGGLLLTFQQP